MFCLSIHVGQVVWQMLYKTEEVAKTIEKGLADAYCPTDQFGIASKITIHDDFGQTATVINKSLHGWMLEDLDLSKLAHVEKGLHNARTQNDYVKRVQSDPSAQPRMQGGPSVLSPMGGNGLFRPQ